MSSKPHNTKVLAQIVQKGKSSRAADLSAIWGNQFRGLRQYTHVQNEQFSDRIYRVTLAEPEAALLAWWTGGQRQAV